MNSAHHRLPLVLVLGMLVPAGLTNHATAQVQLAALSPAEGTSRGGDSVTLTGQGFQASGGGTVTFDGRPASNVVVVSDVEIQCTTPTGPAGTLVDVQVTNANGSATLSAGFLYAPHPALSNLQPSQGVSAGGTRVRVTGSGFQSHGASTPTVTFDGVPAANVRVANDGTLTCLTPPGTPGALVDVSLANENGDATLAQSFHYLPLATETRILPLGDSITASETPFASYRYYLWRALERDGYAVDFVGSQFGVRNGPPAFAAFDQDHEGHNGFTTSQILANLPNWAQAANPDVVLLHLGTNDLYWRNPVQDIVQRLGLIIDELRLVNANVTVLLAQIIKARSFGIDVTALNAAIPGLAAQKTTLTSPVIVVDHATGFDTQVFLQGDGLHPNLIGEEFMGDRWFDALAPRLTPARATHEVFGAGCAGTLGTPTLAPLGGDRALLGTNLDVTLGPLPTGPTFAFGALGFSASDWLSVPLPFALDPLGAPGCAILVSPDIAFAVPNASGSASWTLELPHQLSLLGFAFYQQGYAVDPAANSLGMVASNAIRFVLGSE